jgi:hypothetical protein
VSRSEQRVAWAFSDRVLKDLVEDFDWAVLGHCRVCGGRFLQPHVESCETIKRQSVILIPDRAAGVLWNERTGARSILLLFLSKCGVVICEHLERIRRRSPGQAPAFECPTSIETRLPFRVLHRNTKGVCPILHLLGVMDSAFSRQTWTGNLKLTLIAQDSSSLLRFIAPFRCFTKTTVCIPFLIGERYILCVESGDPDVGLD